MGCYEPTALTRLCVVKYLILGTMHGWHTHRRQKNTSAAAAAATPRLSTQPPPPTVVPDKANRIKSHELDPRIFYSFPFKVENSKSHNSICTEAAYSLASTLRKNAAVLSRPRRMASASAVSPSLQDKR
jgi:hypothetical protein